MEQTPTQKRLDPCATVAPFAQYTNMWMQAVNLDGQCEAYFTKQTLFELGLPQSRPRSCAATYKMALGKTVIDSDAIMVWWSPLVCINLLHEISNIPVLLLNNTDLVAETSRQWDQS